MPDLPETETPALDLTALHREHFDALVWRIMARVSSQALAQEIAQEAFTKAFRFRAQYDGRATPEAWLWSIARNTIASYLRTERAMISGRTSTDPERLATTELDPEAWAITRDWRRSRIRGLARATTPLQRRVLWLVLARGLRYEEIAREMDTTVASVKNLALRARELIS
ncbi:MAG: RNA polymerase sigma factor [Bdellovibrionota bacterium]